MSTTSALRKEVVRFLFPAPGGPTGHMTFDILTDVVSISQDLDTVSFHVNVQTGDIACMREGCNRRNNFPL